MAVSAFDMLVPETPMHKDHFLPSGKDEIWFTGQVFAVETETVPQRMRN
jgi:hypothetical protein